MTGHRVSVENCLYVTETIVSSFDVTLQICNIHCHKKRTFCRYYYFVAWKSMLGIKCQSYKRKVDISLKGNKRCITSDRSLKNILIETMHHQEKLWLISTFLRQFFIGLNPEGLLFAEEVSLLFKYCDLNWKKKTELVLRTIIEQPSESNRPPRPDYRLIRL